MILSWREAREALTDSGRGANEAQDILDDLARFPGRALSYAVPGGVRWLSYAGTSGGPGRPVYASDETRPR